MKETSLIIGGNSGIGLACAKRLLADDYPVITASRSKHNDQLPTNISHFSIDITNLSESFEFLPDKIGSLIYCPGSINLKPFINLETQDFIDDFEINVLGFINILQVCIQKLKNATNPSVVLFSTVAVKQGISYHSSIACAKGALEGLARSLAAEYAASGIRFNAIAPSIIDTPLANKYLSTEAKRENIAKKHPLNKIGTPDQIASFVEVLISDSSNWMTGQIINIDGGLSSIRP